MSLRRSPKLTPAALAARRANALKSTGPRTARGQARSCLNALRHGWDARGLRDKIERTGDKEAAVLFDWIFTRFFELCSMASDRSWRYHMRLAARVWCHISGRVLVSRSRKSEYKGWPILHGAYGYGGELVCPRELTLLNYRDVGIRFSNPFPSRRREKRFAWIPQVEFIDPPPGLPRAKRVRERKRPGQEPLKITVRGPVAAGASAADAESTKNVVGTKLECRVESATSPGGFGTAHRAGGHDDWATLGQLIPTMMRSPSAAGRTPDPDVGSTNDVVGTKLECLLKSATCPGEFGPGDWAVAKPEDWAKLAPLLTTLAAAARLEEEICGPLEDDEIGDESEFGEDDGFWDDRPN